MTEPGTVIVQETRELYGSSYTYRLGGGPVYFVSERYLYDESEIKNGRFRLGPYRFRVLASDWPSDGVECVLDEPRWWPLWARSHIANWWRNWLTLRLVLTLVVWGVARKPYQGEIVGWHLVKRSGGRA